MEPAETPDAQTLKAIIQESVCEIVCEEWLRFFELTTPYVTDAEQAEIEETFNPANYADGDFINITSWFDYAGQA
jgi:hypothetical protein